MMDRTPCFHMSPLELFNPIPESLIVSARAKSSPSATVISTTTVEPSAACYPGGLEWEEDDEEDLEVSCHSSSSRVSFNVDVKVVEIPSHRDYPEETRELLWRSSSDLAVDVERNSFEFCSDGEDWRAATEEQDFAQLPSSGELVHPATWLRETKSYGAALRSLKRRRSSSSRQRRGSRSGRVNLIHAYMDDIVSTPKRSMKTSSSTRPGQLLLPSWFSQLLTDD
ncbi:expressed unknown protein [Seminavis robusta]|uniref:Uncharacterized protein n=1 Tax=Seminavis robusta TaxID=568900 RepID=A0A9N8HKK7_9STRA|nr:expressed unknown protein [Seminavis robusta]|eukprot:Sro622_g176920.1 n/a (225) ;mRNA; f:15828-16502